MGTLEFKAYVCKILCMQTMHGYANISQDKKTGVSDLKLSKTLRRDVSSVLLGWTWILSEDAELKIIPLTWALSGWEWQDVKLAIEALDNGQMKLTKVGSKSHQHSLSHTKRMSGHSFRAESVIISQDESDVDEQDDQVLWNRKSSCMVLF